MNDTNWTNAYEIIEIIEANINFGPGGASIKNLEQTTDIETLIQKPFDYLPFLPNTIYIRNDSIRINYEIESSIGSQICDDPDTINWSQNHQNLLGFDIRELSTRIGSRISGEMKIHGEYWRINGPDDNSCFDVRDYYLLVIEMPIGKNNT